MDEGRTNEQRVVPPPLLHATPQVILDMRHLSTLNFLNSISDILAHLDDEDVLQAWQALQDLVMPNAAALPDSTDLHRARLDLLIGVIVRTCNPPRRAATLSDDDPFAGPSLLAGIRKGVHTELLAALASDNAQTALMHERWRIAVRQRAESAVIAVIRTELVGPSKLLANAGIEAFIEVRTTPRPTPAVADPVAHCYISTVCRCHRIPSASTHCPPAYLLQTPLLTCGMYQLCYLTGPTPKGALPHASGRSAGVLAGSGSANGLDRVERRTKSRFYTCDGCYADRTAE